MLTLGLGAVAGAVLTSELGTVAESVSPRLVVLPVAVVARTAPTTLPLLLLGTSALACAVVLLRRRRRPARMRAWRQGAGARAGSSRPAAPGSSASRPGVHRSARSRARAWLGRLPWPFRPTTPDPAAVLVEMLDELATALEAGLPAGRAVAIVLTSHGPPAWADGLLDDAAAGRRLARAWSHAATHVPVGDVARAWELSERTGAPLADAVRTGAEVLRARQRLDRRRAATTAGARVTMNLLTALPAFGLVVVIAIGLDPVDVYGNVIGLVCLWFGGLLLLVGRAVVQRMIAAATRGTPA